MSTQLLFTHTPAPEGTELYLSPFVLPRRELFGQDAETGQRVYALPLVSRRQRNLTPIVYVRDDTAWRSVVLGTVHPAARYAYADADTAALAMERGMRLVTITDTERAYTYCVTCGYTAEDPHLPPGYVDEAECDRCHDNDTGATP